MKLENQVCAVEYSKKLERLGVKQESLFYWVLETNETKWQIWHKNRVAVANKGSLIISAFTVVELGSLLKEAGPEATIRAYGDLHGFNGTGSIGSIGILRLLTEPDRLAKMLIYLLENKLITL